MAKKKQAKSNKGVIIGVISFIGIASIIAYLYFSNNSEKELAKKEEQAKKELANAKTEKEKKVAKAKIEEIKKKQEKAVSRIKSSNDLVVFDMFDPKYYTQFDTTGENKINSLDSSIDSIAVNLHNELNDVFVSNKKIASYLEPVDTKAKVSQLSGYYNKLYGKTLDVDLKKVGKIDFEKITSKLATLPRA